MSNHGTANSDTLSAATTGDRSTEQGVKHTPGPWAVEPDKSWRNHSCCYDFAITAFVEGKKAAISETLELGDARLIAAAPDMLACLKEFDSISDALADEGYFNDRRREAWARLRGAIAKATGAA